MIPRPRADAESQRRFPSLRQYELDQVQRIAAPAQCCAPSASQRLAGAPPGQWAKVAGGSPTLSIGIAISSIANSFIRPFDPARRGGAEVDRMQSRAGSAVRQRRPRPPRRRTPILAAPDNRRFCSASMRWPWRMAMVKLPSAGLCIWSDPGKTLRISLDIRIRGRQRLRSVWPPLTRQMPSGKLIWARSRPKSAAMSPRTPAIRSR